MKILTVPDKRLLRVADEVTEGEKCGELIDEMFSIIDGKGIGLAAPQIGVNKRIIVISYNSTRHAIINPEIEFNKKIRPKLFDEGCLSVPGVRVQVRRWRKAKVRGFDENWQLCALGARTI